MKINMEYFQQEDVLHLSKDLLGKYLFTNTDGKVTAGMITETEAYMAPEDKASHAYGNRRTERTEIFFREGGVAYVYLCYGIHNLFNIITNKKEVPHAILVRAIEPLEGVDMMLKRRKKDRLTPELTSGPGSLTKALGIDRSFNGLDLTGKKVWLEDHGAGVNDDQIVKSPRVGIDYAAEYVLKPWRFRIKGNKYTSKPR